MRRFYPYYWLQVGGEKSIPGPVARDPVPMLPVITSPREFMRMSAENSTRGDIPTYFRLPDRRVGEDDLQKKLLEQKAQKAAALKAQQKKKRPLIPPADHNVKGDLPTYFRLPGRGYEENRIEQAIAERKRLQHNIGRLGYNAHTAEIFARKGQENLQPYMQKQLEEQAQVDYRVKNHPDYNPYEPVERQQYLNHDNSLRTRLLRGRNMLVDTGNPITDFVAETITAPGKSFANLTMDADKQYFKPGLMQGALNLGSDLLALVPAEKAVTALVNRSSPRALGYMAQPLAQGTEDLGRWYFSKAASNKTIGQQFPKHAAFAKDVQEQFSRGVPFRQAVESSYRDIPEDVVSQVDFTGGESPVEVYRTLTKSIDDLEPGKIWYNESYSLDSYPLMLNHLSKRVDPNLYKVVPGKSGMPLNQYGFKSYDVIEALPEELREAYRNQVKQYDQLVSETRKLENQLSQTKGQKEAEAISAAWDVNSEKAKALKKSLAADLNQAVLTNPSVRERLASGFNERIQKVNRLYGVNIPMATATDQAVMIPQFYIYKKDPNWFSRVNALPSRLGLDNLSLKSVADRLRQRIGVPQKPGMNLQPVFESTEYLNPPWYQEQGGYIKW